MSEKVLLLGGGMLATDIVAAAGGQRNVIALDHAALDVTDARAVGALLDREQPPVVINTAAFTRVDDAESRRDEVWRVNAMAPGTLGRLCAAAGVNVVHFSTDYVFDGSGSIPYVEDSPPNPINHYGASKLAGERGLMESGAEFLLIRTQWLYGSTGRSFPATMWERAKTGTETRVVNDQHGRPTSAASVARALWQLIDAGADGVYHVANRGVATWYEVAERIFTAFGVQELVTPCTTADFPTPAARPAYSVLDTGKLEREAGIWLPHWTDALEDWTASREPGTGNREPVTGNR